MTTTHPPRRTTVTGPKTERRDRSLPGQQTESHHRGRLAVGVAAAAVAVGAFVATRGNSGVEEQPLAPAAAVAAETATVFPYLEVEGRGTIADQGQSAPQAVESERPLLLDGEAFAAALAAATAATDGQALLDGDDLARAVEEALAQAGVSVSVTETSDVAPQQEEGTPVVPDGAS